MNIKVNVLDLIAVHIPVPKQPLTHLFQIGVLENFAIFTEKHLCWSLFLTKLQA